MAGVCRRLSLLLPRNWSPSACRLCPRTLTTSSYPQTECHGNREPSLVLSRLCTPPALRHAAAITCQHYTTKAVDSTPAVEAGEEMVEEPPGIFRRFWRWLQTDDDPDDYRMSTEEREERDQLMIRLQEMYFADPPIEPDLDFCKDVLRMLIKYNDRLGVEVAWSLMKEMKVQPDEELEYIVPAFLKECREKL